MPPIFPAVVNQTPKPLPELRRAPTDDQRHSPHWWVWTTDDAQRYLANWPLLRHLLFEPRFRYAWLACAFFVLLLAVGLPPIWIVTPRDFLPVIRISLLNMVEARVHAGLARSAEARDERETAFYHWRSAVAFNSTDAEVLRSSISNLLHLPPRNVQRAGQGRWAALWLLHLNRTNAADLDLVTDVYRHYGTDEQLVPLLAGTPRPLTDHQHLALIKGRLQANDHAGFLSVRTNLAPAVAAGDPELPLYDAAAQLMWGDEAAAAAAKDVLARAQTPEHADVRVRALRLQLLAGLVRRNPEEVAPALGRLRDLHVDYPLEHAAYWELLHVRGRTAEAVQLARQFADPPITAGEVARLCDTFLRLGLTEQATDFLQHFAPSLGSLSRIWITYADLLIQQQNWDEIRGLALEIRKNDFTRGSLGGFSLYLEGLAELSTHHTNDAAVIFAKVPRGTIREPDLVMRIARDLAAWDNYQPALELLRFHQGELQQRLDYWQALVRAAYHEHDAGMLLDAAQHQYALAPDRVEAVTDLAAALLIHRRDPKQALELTRRVLDSNPTSLGARINHALALLQNENPGAAKPLLLSVDESQLGGIERTMLAFARTDLERQQGRPAQALREMERIDPAYLLPPQIAWLDLVRAGLQPRIAPAH